MLNVGLAFSSIVVVGHLLGGRTPVKITILDAALFFLFAASKWILRQGMVRAAGIGALLVSFIFATAASAALGTIRTPTTAIYILIVIMAGLLFHGRGLLAAVSLSSAVIAALIFAENMDLLPRPDYRVTITQWFTYTALLALAGSVVHRGFREIHRSLRKSDRQFERLNQLHHELSAKEHRLRQITEHAEDVIYRYRFLPTPGFEVLSPAIEAVSGYTAQDFEADPGLDRSIIHPDDLHILYEHLNANEPTAQMVVRWIRKDGRVIYVEQQVRYIRNTAGEVEAVEGIARDVSQRRLQERLLEFRAVLSERAYNQTKDELIQSLLDFAEGLTGSTIGFFHFVEDDQENLRLQTWSTNTLKSMCNLEGKGHAYAIKDAGIWVDAFYAKKPVIHNDYATENHRKGYPQGHAPIVRELTIPVIRKEKVKAIIGVGNKPVPYDEGDLQAAAQLADFAWDIIERKTAEESLAENLQMHQQIIASSREGIIVYGPDLRYRVWSPAMEAMTGKKSSEVLGKHPLEVFPFLPEAGVFGRLEAVLRGEPGGETVWSMPSLVTGATLWASDLTAPLKDFSGNVVGVVGSVRDITELQARQAEIAEFNRNFETFLEQTTDFIYFKDKDSRFRFCSQALAGITGHKSWRDMIGKNDMEVFPPDTARIYNEEEQAIFDEGKPLLGAIDPYYDADGKIGYVQTNKWPLFDEVGQVVGIFGISRDITEMKRAEQRKTELEARLAHMQKLESIGTLAGGIAHDFNNLLGGIFGYVEMAHEHLRLGDHNRLNADLENAMRPLARARDLTRQLLTFTKSLPETRPGSIGVLLRESVQFGLAGSNVIARLDVPEELPLCEMDPNQMSQVVDNLLINARQAMPSGGTVFIRARRVEIDDSSLPIEAGEYVEVTFQDSGPGISPEHLPHIFDPFFSTKPGGHGLGLATSYSIVRKHRGLLSAESPDGGGALFRFLLPMSASSPMPEAGAAPIRYAGSGRVLVMDDDEDMRTVLCEMVEMMGYEVRSASSGEEALKIAEAARDEGRDFQIAILDLTVPGGLGGREIVRQLEAIHPGLRAVAASGYANDPVMSDPRAFGFVAGLSKPYSIEDLGILLKRIQ